MQINDQIPQSLKSQFSAYTRTLFTSETFITVGVAASVVLGSFLLLFISDRIWDTPRMLRIIFPVAGIAVVVAFLLWFGRNWIWKRRGLKQLAARIQTKHRNLGDRLLGAIELSQGAHADEYISEELRQAAILRVAEQASAIDFNKDVDKKRPVQAVIAMVLLTGLIIALFSLLPQAFHNALIRWCNPMASISRYTFIVLEKMPATINVPKGEPFEITCRLAPESRWIPAKLFYQIPGVTQGEAAFQKDLATIKLEGLNSPAKLKIHSGDTGDVCTIDPVHRPSLIEMTSKYKYPDYVGRAEEETVLKNGELTMLKGSTYSLTGNVSRKLASAKYTDAGKKTDLKTAAATFFTGEIIAEKDQKLTFTWQDVLGFSPTVPFDLMLKIKDDREPYAECPGLAHFSAILIDEAMNIKLKADDDFGVKDLAAIYAVGISDGKKVREIRPKIIPLATGSKDKTELDSETQFAPDLLGIPEKSLVTFQALASDYYPGREAVRSVPYRIYILSREQHMKLIQDRLERIMSDLEDMIRREDASLQKNQKLSKLAETELKKSENSEKIKEQELREDAERKEARKMADDAMKLLKEALRNKKFPEKTIAQWSEFMEKINSLANQEMKNVVAGLQQAADQKNPKKNMGDAVENQEILIEQLKKMLKKMDDSMEAMALDSFVNRLKKEATRERGIAKELKTILPEIVGLPADKITGSLKEQVGKQITTQQSVNQSAQDIRDDLIAFFSRTRVEKYQKVTDDMEKIKLEAKLRELLQLLEENFTSKGIFQANGMADKFDEWAKLLSQSDNNKSDQEQGKQQQIDSEFILGLLRVIQGEQNLRSKTRYLDKNKPSQAEEYKDSSLMLAGDQGDLHVKLMFLTNKAQSCPKAVQLLERAGSIMDEVVEYLRKPQTDPPVIAAQTEIIELLSGALQQSCNQAGSSSAMMAMMMQMMMGTAAGQSGTGSTMGGTTDAANMQFNDPEFKKEDPERNTDKTQGTGTVEIPEEFKSAIEAYFKKRSQIKEK